MEEYNCLAGLDAKPKNKKQEKEIFKLLNDTLNNTNTNELASNYDKNIKEHLKSYLKKLFTNMYNRRKKRFFKFNSDFEYVCRWETKDEDDDKNNNGNIVENVLGVAQENKNKRSILNSISSIIIHEILDENNNKT